MRVKKIMTRNPVTVAPQDSLRRAIALMKEGGFRRLPVVEEQRLVGIITDRDIRLASNSPIILREKWQDEYLLDNVQVEVCMTPDPVVVAPNTGVEKAAKLMRDRKVGGLPVMQGDKLVGIVTETDVLDYFIQLLEGGAFVCKLEKGTWGLDLSAVNSFRAI
jgi:acetoin utilization protein AcuB